MAYLRLLLEILSSLKGLISSVHWHIPDVYLYLNISPETQKQISHWWRDISSRISNRYIKLNILQTGLILLQNLFHLQPPYFRK